MSGDAPDTTLDAPTTSFKCLQKLPLLTVRRSVAHRIRLLSAELEVLILQPLCKPCLVWRLVPHRMRPVSTSPDTLSLHALWNMHTELVSDR
jgi:hypothetical protein